VLWYSNIDQGWALGARLRDKVEGWFPSEYWAPMQIEGTQYSGPGPVSAQAVGQPTGSYSHSVQADSAIAQTGIPSIERVSNHGVDKEEVKVAESVASRPASQAASVAAELLHSTFAYPTQGLASVVAVADTEPVPDSKPTNAQSSGGDDARSYNRDLLLQLGITMRNSADERESKKVGILMLSRPPKTEPTPAQQHLDRTVRTLVELAGGKARVGNLAAAGLALGVMTGTHSKVCQEILAAVKENPNSFTPPVEEASFEASKLIITLKNADSG